MKKFFSLCIAMVILLHTSIVWADIEDSEKVEVNKIKEEVIETSGALNDEPKLNARIATIYDRASGRILYEKNGNKQTPMASTTKIMTAIVVLEKSDLKEVVTVDSQAAGTGGSRLGLKKNDKITINDLLYGLMLCSGNDAAICLAKQIAGSVEGFAEIMNQKALELGLNHSHFVVPHGLDMPEHYTTAVELAKMADYALSLKEFKEIVGTKSYTVTINGQPKTISNTNELLGNLDGVYGVKTGFTNGAGRCLVTSCKRNNLDIITVVLGADTKKIRTADSIKLIEYAFKNYKMIDVKQMIEEEFERWKDTSQARIEINKGIKQKMELKLEEIPYQIMAVKHTETDNVAIEINNLYSFEAPVKENQVIGNMRIKVGEEVVEMLEIYNKEEVRKKKVKDYLLELLKMCNPQYVDCT